MRISSARGMFLRAAAAVMAGKAVILVEGSPQALILPVTLSGLLLTAEDG